MAIGRRKHKVVYEIDPYGRLVITGRRRRIVEGYFESEENQLAYRLVSSPGGESITFKGRWSLGKEHNLCFRVEEAEDRAGSGKFSFSGEIVRSDKSGIAFSVLNRCLGGRVYARIIKLRGSWKTDEFNRLVLCVENEGGNNGRIVFSGIWEINDNLEIVYTYVRPGGRGKESKNIGFTLQGVWQVAGDRAVSFLIDGDNARRLDFKAEMSVSSLQGRRGEVRYRIGAGIIAAQTRRLILFGSWKLKRDLSIGFEVKYKNGSTYINSFQISRAFGDKNNISLLLSNREIKGPEFVLVFERAFFKSAKWFLRLFDKGFWIGGVVPF